MKTTHRCAKSDGEDNLITERKSYFVEEVTTEQGGAHEGDGEGDVADARDVGAIFIRGAGEERETDAEGGEGGIAMRKVTAMMALIWADALKSQGRKTRPRKPMR